MQPDPMLGRVLGGTFAIEQPLGSGGFGAVYVARHNRTGKAYAVKVLRPDRAATSTEAVARFRREAQALARLGHPGIVAIHDFATTEDGVDYLVMDLLEGEDLAQRLQSVGKLELPAALALVEQIGAALSVAHDAGIVHRDLKPANVFLAQAAGVPERALVLDFGLAKMVEPEGVESLTTTGVPMGTPLYMAPEQARGEPTDARTDQYALATIFFEMLAGGPPFMAKSVPQIMVQLLTAPPPALNSVANVPSHVHGAVARALSKLPDERFDHIAHFVAALNGDTTHIPTPAATKGQTGKVEARPLGLADTHPTPVNDSPRPWTALHGSDGAPRRRSMTPLAIGSGLLAALALGAGGAAWALLAKESPHRAATEPVFIASSIEDEAPPTPAPPESHATAMRESLPDDSPPRRSPGMTTRHPSKRSNHGRSHRTKRSAAPPQRPPSARQAAPGPADPAPATTTPPPSPAHTTESPGQQDLFRDQAREAEHQATEIRSFLARLATLRQSLSGLSAGREPALCGAGVRGRLQARSDVSAVVGAAQRLRSEVDRVCDRFTRLANPSPRVRRMLRNIAPTLERAQRMTREPLSSNQPEAIAREVDRAIDEARRALDGVAEHRRPFPCADRVWSKLRRLSDGANSYSGAAAERVTRLRGQICSATGMRPELLRRAERSFNERLDAAERTLRQAARRQGETALRLRATLEAAP